METRYSIALKVLNWDENVSSLVRVAEEFNVSTYDFNHMTDEEFFHELFRYVHNRDTLTVS